MRDPKIVPTRTTRTTRTTRSGAPTSPRPGSRGDRPRSSGRTSRALPAVWGLLLLLGGIAVWASLADRSDPLPEVWKQTSPPEGAVAAMHSGVRPGGGRQGDLLRLEWPAHPNAAGYRIRFFPQGQHGTSPVPVQGTVFLYDLKSDVLRLTERFDWQVTAEMGDGSEVVTPRRSFPE